MPFASRRVGPGASSHISKDYAKENDIQAKWFWPRGPRVTSCTAGSSALKRVPLAWVCTASCITRQRSTHHRKHLYISLKCPFGIIELWSTINALSLTLWLAWGDVDGSLQFRMHVLRFVGCNFRLLCFIFLDNMRGSFFVFLICGE